MGDLTRTIYKYMLDPRNQIDPVEMPAGALILSAGEQGNNICIWAMVDLADPQPLDTRYFEVFGTGHPMHVDMGIDRRFIGTVHMPTLGLVFHVFERTGV